MKPLLLLAAVSAIPLGATACAPKTPATRAALDCPTSQGALTRTAAAADGKSCTYVSADGAEVTLQLIPVQGGPYATLDALETTLLADLKADDSKAATVDAKPDPGSAAEAAKVADQAAKDTTGVEIAAETGDAAGVTVNVDEDGVVVGESGGKTRVNLPGIHIVADEDEDSANVRIGPLHVDASSEGAVIHIRRDVRLKGEALSREKRGIRATFIAKGSRRPDDDRYLGYEAGGPKIGPLAVAVVRARVELDDSDDVYRDVKKLVRRNGGV